MTGYDVSIIAEGIEEDIKLFTKAIQIQKYPIQVTSLEIVEKEYSGTFQYFEIIRRPPDEELEERFDPIIHYLARIDSNFQIIADNSSKMVDRQDQALIIEEDTNGLLKETLTEVKGIRSDFGSRFDTEFQEIKSELHEIRNALIQAGIMKISHPS